MKRTSPRLRPPARAVVGVSLATLAVLVGLLFGPLANASPWQDDPVTVTFRAEPHDTAAAAGGPVVRVNSSDDLDFSEGYQWSVDVQRDAQVTAQLLKSDITFGGARWHFTRWRVERLAGTLNYAPDEFYTDQAITLDVINGAGRVVMVTALFEQEPASQVTYTLRTSKALPGKRPVTLGGAPVTLDDNGGSTQVGAPGQSVALHADQQTTVSNCEYYCTHYFEFWYIHEPIAGDRYVEQQDLQWNVQTGATVEAVYI